jgi:acetyltransferase-like isoleucine patch superfamily enzyme
MWYIRKIYYSLKNIIKAIKIFRLKHELAKRGIVMTKAKIYGDNLSNLVLGENIWLNDAFLDVQNIITIESRVNFGHQVKILTGSHDVKKFWKEREKSLSRPVIIRTGAWIASFAIILPGTEIGEHSVVAAGSVVRGKVPPYTLVAGNPAQIVKDLHPKKDAKENFQ